MSGNVVYPYRTFKDVIFISWSWFFRNVVGPTDGPTLISSPTHTMIWAHMHCLPSRTRQYIVRKNPFGVMTGFWQSRIDAENACRYQIVRSRCRFHVDITWHFLSQGKDKYNDIYARFFSSQSWCWVYKPGQSVDPQSQSQLFLYCVWCSSF